jgi:apolipoprotein N-acyltransferase
MSAASASYSARRSPGSPGLGVRSAWAHGVMVLGTFILMTLAFPGPGWSLLAHIALVPLTLVAMRSTRKRTLLWTTYLGGVLWWLLMIHWLDRVTFGGYVTLCLYLGIYWPVYAMLMRIMHQRTRWPKCLSVPAVWVSLEFIRAHVLAGGFGWFAIGHSQAPYHPLQGPGQIVQIADIFGQWGVSFLVAMTSGMIVDMVTRPWNKPSRKWYRLSPAMRSVGLWMLAMISTLFYGAYRIRTTPMAGPSVKVAVVQTNVPQSNKETPSPESVVTDWKRAMELTIDAADQSHPDMIIWPETMSPAAFNAQALEYYQTAPTMEKGYEVFYYQTESLASKLNVNLFAGAHAKFDWQIITTNDDKQYVVPMKRFNSVFHFPPKVGMSVTRYDKIHLVPFGEYIPWVSSVPWLKHLFMEYFSPHKIDYSLSSGQEKVLFKVPVDGREIMVASPICFEDTIGRLVHQMVYDGMGNKRVDLLINLTNDGWYAGSIQAYEHTQNAVFRCIENRVPMARSVNTGISGFINSAGELSNWVQVGDKFQDVDGWSAKDVILDSRTTFFGRWGRWPMMILMLLTGTRLVFATLVPRKVL